MEEIFKDIVIKTKEQLFKYPEDSISLKLKKAIEKIISGGNPFKKNNFFWPNALLAMGIERHYSLIKDQSDLECLRKFYDFWIKKGIKINYIDQAIHGYVLISLYEFEESQNYKKVIDLIFGYLKNYPKTKDGGLPYRKGNKNLVFLDGIGMTCPFLARYGHKFKNEEATNMAITQILSYINNGLDKFTGLPYHGYNSIDSKKIGIIGWGRGVGWLLIGIIDSLEYIPKKMFLYEYIEKKFIEIVKTTIKYQNSNGSFAWQILATEGYSDTSATSMIAYAIERAIRLKILDDSYRKNCYLALESILSYTKNGLIFGCSAECRGIGMYPQIYDTYPWSQGPATALAALLEPHNSNKKFR